MKTDTGYGANVGVYSVQYVYQTTKRKDASIECNLGVCISNPYLLDKVEVYFKVLYFYYLIYLYTNKKLDRENKILPIHLRRRRL